MTPLSAADRARRAKVQPFDGYDGLLLARLAVLCRELQRDAGDQPFRCPVRFVQAFFDLGQVAHASNLLRQLEVRDLIKCVRRGTQTKGDVRGVPSLYRLNEDALQQKLSSQS